MFYKYFGFHVPNDEIALQPKTEKNTTSKRQNFLTVYSKIYLLDMMAIIILVSH